MLSSQNVYNFKKYQDFSHSLESYFEQGDFPINLRQLRQSEVKRYNERQCLTVVKVGGEVVDSTSPDFVQRNIILDIIVKMICNTNNSEDNQIFERKDRYSNSTCSSTSSEDESSPIKHINSNYNYAPNSMRLELFENQNEPIQISQKLNQRAVSWMITLCWSKSFSQECLWSTLLLYYSFKTLRRVRKEQLQLVMLASLSLSLKISINKSYSASEIAALANRSLSASDLIVMEGTILQAVDFNVIIPHNLSQLFFEGWVQSELLQQVLCVCELLMVRDFSIFFNKSKLQDIIQMFGGQQMQCCKWRGLKDEVKELLVLKQCKIILNKYSSKFNTEVFKDKFI